MPFPHKPARLLLIAPLCVLASPRAAHALERVTLRNGFSYDCVERQPVEHTTDNRIRLFMAPGPADKTTQPQPANYVDIPAASIASIETLPDPPAPSPVPLPPTNTPVDMRSLLTHAGTEHNIDVELLASLVKAESAGHPTAVSRAGARGLMQLMPATARELGVKDAFVPEQNVNGGTAYLDALLTRYKNNLAFALAAYNAGPAAVDRYHGVPPFRETRAYVTRVMNEFKRRKLALENIPRLSLGAH